MPLVLFLLLTNLTSFADDIIRSPIREGEDRGLIVILPNPFFSKEMYRYAGDFLDNGGYQVPNEKRRDQAIQIVYDVARLTWDMANTNPPDANTIKELRPLIKEWFDAEFHSDDFFDTKRYDQRVPAMFADANVPYRLVDLEQALYAFEIAKGKTIKETHRWGGPARFWFQPDETDCARYIKIRESEFLKYCQDAGNDTCETAWSQFYIEEITGQNTCWIQMNIFGIKYERTN